MRIFSAQLILAMPLVTALGCSAQSGTTSAKQESSNTVQEATRRLVRNMILVQEARNAPLQLDRDYSEMVRPLVEELRSLSPTATFEEFAGRPAMSKLMGMGKNAYPALQGFLLYSDDWAIKVSVGYLVALMDGVTNGATQDRLFKLMNDDHPIVRAMAASLLLRVAGGGSCCGDPVGEHFRSLTDERVIAERFHFWYPILNWMAPEDIAARLDQVMAVIEQPDPYVKPAAWVSGNRVVNSEVDNVTCAQDRLLTRDHDMAERFLNQQFYSSCAYDVKSAVIDSLEKDDGGDPERLGRKFSLAIAALNHVASETACRTFQAALRDRIIASSEKWAWRTNDALALKSILNGIPASLERGHALITGLRDRHPNPSVREIARLRLLEYEQLKARQVGDR